MNRTELVELVSDICNKRIRWITDTPDPAWLKFYIGTLEGLCPVTVVTEANVKLMWEQIRESGIVKTFLSCTSELYFRSGLSREEWMKIHNDLAHALCLRPPVIHSETTIAQSAIDKVLYDRTESQNEIEQLLNANHWLVFLILMTYAKNNLRISTKDITLEEEEEPKD